MYEAQGMFTTIYHDGPGGAFLSKAPNDDLEHYDGKGDWFKIAEALASTNTSWKLLGESDFRFHIPKTTPPGKYLLRMEFFYALSGFNQTQFYISCAHVNVVGPGGGQPKEFIRFPGGYKQDDPGGFNHDLSVNSRLLANRYMV
jgi:hypothetical protein